MKKTILLLLFLCAGTICFAQNTSDTLDSPAFIAAPAAVPSARIAGANAEMARLMDTIRAVSDTLRRVSMIVTNANLLVDTNDVEMAKREPEKRLYVSMMVRHAPHNGWRVFRFIMSLSLMLIILMSGILLARNAGLIRDPSYDANGNLRPIHKRPFSFARVQLLWWTLIITISYVYFFGITGILVPVNMTTAVLLGGGVLVYAGSKLIDNKQIRDAGGLRHQDGDATCEGFFTDILSDESGISMHRFQAAIFNVVFGTAFVAFFVRSLLVHQYPLCDFSDGQFALLGISSAAFLGLKATENKTLPNPVQDVAPTPSQPGNAVTQDTGNTSAGSTTNSSAKTDQSSALMPPTTIDKEHTPSSVNPGAATVTVPEDKKSNACDKDNNLTEEDT